MVKRKETKQSPLQIVLWHLHGPSSLFPFISLSLRALTSKLSGDTTSASVDRWLNTSLKGPMRLRDCDFTYDYKDRRLYQVQRTMMFCQAKGTGYVAPDSDRRHRIRSKQQRIAHRLKGQVTVSPPLRTCDIATGKKDG